MKPLRPGPAIIAVGSELLTPSRIDTNSLFITEQLNCPRHRRRARRCVVGDDREELAARVSRAALARVDLVVCSGGLGPTDDDVTREVVAGVLGRPLAEDAAHHRAGSARGSRPAGPMPMPEINRRQAMVPAGARVLENTNGSAPGLWIEDGDARRAAAAGTAARAEADAGTRWSMGR